jgi:hypothetical protein
MFFSSGGYTAQATTWANQVGMPVFRFDANGDVMAANTDAGSVLREAKGLPPPRNWLPV